MTELLIAAIVITIIAGLLYFLLMRLPLDMGPMKNWGLYAIIAIYAVVMVIKVVIPLLHMLAGSI